ncbi:NAD(P)H-dependent oxidoreductase [Methanobrevibacter sp.]|uniref:NAD(P)H-dependent oxidoreductase n=1 Tax=Methanobrevibacter sp. TaxID=66852 RepID=UPI00386C41EE
MKVHIVYCHPSDDSLTFELKESYLKGLKSSNIDFTISDLYNDNFNSDISEEEYLREANYIESSVLEDVLKEQKLINDADILTFIFPLFWMDAPSKLVGWFSRVFTYGFRYYNDDAPSAMKVFDEVNFLIGTGSSYDDLKADGKIDAIKTIFATDRINDKANKINFYFFSETSHDKITPEIKRQYIDEVFEIAKNNLY